MAPFPHPAHRTGQADFLHPALGQDFTLSRATPSAASEQFSELIGFPISRSFTTYCVCLELRSLPSTGVARLQRYCEPLRHPKAPDLSLAGVRLIIADHAMGLPVLRMRTLSLYTCRRHYPCAASERIASLISSRRISLPRKGCRVDLRIVLFEACSAFTRVAACTLALSPIRDTIIEGFSHFVTSMTAPIASGWSDCRVRFAPTGKRRLCTAHTRSGHHTAVDDHAALASRRSIWLRSTSKSIGLVSSASAPPSKAFRSVSASPYAVIIMTGTSGRVAFAFGKSSRPVMPGMLISDKIRMSDAAATSLMH